MRAGDEKSQRQNQCETVAGAAEMHQRVGDKGEAKQAANDLEIAEEHKIRREITLPKPAREREYTAKGQ